MLLPLVLVKERKDESVAIPLTVEKTFLRAHRRKPGRKVVVARELVHNQVCRKGQLM